MRREEAQETGAENQTRAPGPQTDPLRHPRLYHQDCPCSREKSRPQQTGRCPSQVTRRFYRLDKLIGKDDWLKPHPKRLNDTNAPGTQRAAQTHFAASPGAYTHNQKKKKKKKTVGLLLRSSKILECSCQKQSKIQFSSTLLPKAVEDPGMLLPKAVEDPAQQHAPAKGSRRSHTSSHQKGERPMAKSTLKLNKHNTTTVSHLVPDPIPGTNPLTFFSFSLQTSHDDLRGCHNTNANITTSEIVIRE
jgi:hypothetical protein